MRSAFRAPGSAVTLTPPSVRSHAYTSTVADVYARYSRLSNRDVFFLTGTDEHGQKVEQSAAARGVSPQQLADTNSAAFREVAGWLNVSYDCFHRTSSPAHVRQVGALVERLLVKGDAYLGTFSGWYDAGQEEYVAEEKARELGYKSPVTGRELVRAEEENYYFRLSAFQGRLLELFESRPDFVQPPGRRNEMLARLREGLQDVPISRTNFSWGIPVPSDPRHVIYVWIDALLNYITALGLGEAAGGAEAAEAAARARFWPATVHIMAKEIAWFHSVIWPALLMALELPLPGKVYAHAFWIRDGVKMSKSLGNFVDLEAMRRYTDAYGLDAFRYYLVVDGPMGATDANFSAERLQDIYSAELVNTLGNCGSRVTAMVGKYFEGVLPGELDAQGGRILASASDQDWPARAAQASAEACAAYEALELGEAARAALRLVTCVDVFVQTTEPFRLAKDPARTAELGAILYQCMEALRIAGLLLAPIMPTKMGQLAEALGQAPALTGAGEAGGALPLAEQLRWGGLRPGQRLEKLALFPRVDSPDAEAAPAPATAKPPKTPKIKPAKAALADSSSTN